MIGGGKKGIFRLALNFSPHVTERCSNSPFADFVGVTYEQKRSVNHLLDVITWDTQKYSMLQTTALNANKTRTGILLSEREKILERKRQEERHKIHYYLPREPEEQSIHT